MGDDVLQMSRGQKFKAFADVVVIGLVVVAASLVIWNNVRSSPAAPPSRRPAPVVTTTPITIDNSPTLAGC